MKTSTRPAASSPFRDEAQHNVAQSVACKSYWCICPDRIQCPPRYPTVEQSQRSQKHKACLLCNRYNCFPLRSSLYRSEERIVCARLSDEEVPVFLLRVRRGREEL